jgi:hypothetical protein
MKTAGLLPALLLLALTIAQVGKASQIYLELLSGSII